MGSRRLQLLSGLLVIAICLGAYLLVYGTARSTSSRPVGPRYKPQAHGIAEIVSAQALADSGQPSGAVLMLGDSITEQFRQADRLAPIVINYGVSGQTTQGLLRALPHYGAARRARFVVLMIGTNDVSQGLTQDIESRLRAISARIQVPLVWHLVPPTTRGDVESTNAIIRRICDQRSDCTLVNTFFRPEDYTDGTHFSPSGYAKWSSSLRRAIEANRQ
jgi:lysophospholipase L1-like esterase